MDYRRLGVAGPEVSRLCLGTMMFAEQTDITEAGRMVDIAREAGVNFIDTADQYSFGGAEEMIGRLIAADRDKWVLATKVGNYMSDDPAETGLGRAWLTKEIDRSLGRLATDYVDIYYLHRDDWETPLEQTLETLKTFLAAGKIRHYGVSNYLGWRIAEVVRIADTLGMPRPVVCQPYYNAMNRLPEVEVLPASGHYGLGVVPYSPLARGVLTGKYAPQEKPDEGTRAGRGDKRILESEFRQESLEIAQIIKARCEARGLAPGQWAINWVLANPFITSVIAGPRTAEQWQDNIAALDHPWDPDDETFLDDLVTPGHPSTPGYSDPSYPLRGRPV